MHHIDPIIMDIALIMVVAGITTVIFRKLNQPIVLGYILAGFLISPHFHLLPSVGQLDSIHSWANLGIIFLMFALGLEFSFTKIADVGTSAVVTALSVMTSMVFVGIIIGKLLGFSSMDSVFLGGMLSMSSTMIILKTFEEKQLKEEKFATLVLGTLVIEDIGGIFMMIILSTISISNSVSGGVLVGEIGILLLLLITWLLLGIYIIPTILRKIKGLINDELLLVVSIGICFGMVVIAYWIGFSEALGAFVAGSILAGTISGHKIETLVKPIKDMFGAVFFISVGMLVQPELLLTYTVPIIIITLATVLGQMFFSTIGMILSGQCLHTAVRGGMSMMQIGEFSFIVATLGLSLGVTGEFLYPIIVCVSVITIFLTPISVNQSERVYELIQHNLPQKAYEFLENYTSDKRSNTDKDKDWFNYLKRYVRRTIILLASMFFIYYLGKKVLLPFLEQHMEGLIPGIVATGITCLFMIPIISLVGNKNNNEFKKLWIKNKTNRLPLTSLWAVQFLITLFFMVLTWRRFLEVPSWILAIGGFIILVFVLKNGFFRSQSIKVEARFISNFNEKILHNQSENESIWVGDELKAVEFGLADAGMCTNVRLLLNEKILDVLIIKVVRNGKHINMPGPEEEICTGDVVTAVSSRGQLEAYLIALEKADHIKTPTTEMISLKDYMSLQSERNVPAEDQIMCCAIPIDKETPFVKKTIKTSEFRKKYKGFIVGIVRNHYPMIDPPVKTIIEEGDIIWAIGRQSMADKLIQDNIMHE